MCFVGVGWMGYVCSHKRFAMVGISPVLGSEWEVLHSTVLYATTGVSMLLLERGIHS